MKKHTPDPEDKKQRTFTKNQLLRSKKYRDKQDLLNALLKSDKTYSIEEVDSIIDEFMKGKVN